jgi:hypothetical protein
MGVVTPNMAIYIPSAGETNYDAPFSAGMVNIDQHDHTGGPNKGVQIGSSGIADGSVTFAKLNLPATAPRQMFQSGAGITPAWSTSTWPATTTANRLLYSSATNVVADLATANNGILVTSNAGVPSILGGPGTTGNILQSNAALPPSYSTATYPSVATGTGTILRANGTNWVPSTATFPDTAGTSGNVLTSDGTNWTSSPPVDGIKIASGTLTNSQIKNLNATPIALIAAPGSGKVIVVVQASIKLIYGGSNIFTSAGGATVSLYYGTSKEALSDDWLTVANLISSVNRFQTLPGLIDSVNAYSNVENTALNAYNPIASEIAGNAANDNTIAWSIMYFILTI